MNCSTILISVCCECKKDYGVKDARGAKGGESHGLCAACFGAAMQRVERKRAERLGDARPSC